MAVIESEMEVFVSDGGVSQVGGGACRHAGAMAVTLRTVVQVDLKPVAGLCINGAFSSGFCSVRTLHFVARNVGGTESSAFVLVER